MINSSLQASWQREIHLLNDFAGPLEDNGLQYGFFPLGKNLQFPALPNIHTHIQMQASLYCPFWPGPTALPTPLPGLNGNAVRSNKLFK